MAPPDFKPLAKEHSQSLFKLLTTGEYSDLTIACGTDKHRVHKAIVCSRSSFFAAACNSEFKESKTGEIDLPEDDPIAVRMMIEYLYTQDYRPPVPPDTPKPANDSIQKPETEPDSAKRRCVAQDNPDGGFSSTPIGYKQELDASGHFCFLVPIYPPNLVLHAKVYALGEKYGINDLKEQALFKFTNNASDYHHHKSFMHAARYVYGSTIKQDRKMRNVVVQTVKTHVDLLDDEEFQSVIKDTELGFDLLLGLTEARRGELKRKGSSL